MMTKFIEGAREIEMDAVAKDGKVCEVLPLASFSYHLQPRSQSFFPWREGWRERKTLHTDSGFKVFLDLQDLHIPLFKCIQPNYIFRESLIIINSQGDLS